MVMFFLHLQRIFGVDEFKEGNTDALSRTVSIRNPIN